eukprot:199004_1
MDDGTTSGKQAQWAILPLTGASVIATDDRYWHGPYTKFTIDTTQGQTTQQRTISRLFYCAQPSKVSIGFSGIACNTESDYDVIKLYFNTMLQNSMPASHVASQYPASGEIDSAFLAASQKCELWNYLGITHVSGLAVPN